MKLVSTGRTISTTEYLEKKHKERRKRLYVACGAFLALLVIAVLVLRLKSLQISSVEVAGAVSTGAEPIEAAARETIAGKYLWLVPKANALLYPHAALEKDVMRRFPRLNAVAASLEGTHLLHIDVSERKPFALFCSDLCYFLDDTGFIFDTSPTFSNGVYFVYHSNESFENPIGQQFLPQPQFENITSFVDGLTKDDLEPLSLSLMQTEGRVDLASGAKILFSRSADMGKTFSALESFLATPEAKVEGFWKKVDTIDMRTENKVFYSFR